MLRLSIAITLCVVSLANAQERVFPEATSGKGKLQYIKNIPVVTLEGTPEEIGSQFGELLIKPAKKPLIEKVDTYMEKIGWAKSFPTMVKFGGLVFARFPKSNQEEIKAAVKVSGIDRDLLTTLNAIPDLAKMGGCSTIIVEPNRSKTSKLMFGRNLDWPPFEGLPDYTSVVIFKSPGKKTVATITLPVIFGCLTGMNEDGLCLAINEITSSKDGSSKRDLSGTPMLLLFRKILEECSTVEEAEKLLKASGRTTWFCLTACDTKGGCVFESTPKNVIRRESVNELCCCTNHFLTAPLSTTNKCWRYEKFEKIQSAKNKLGLEEVNTALHEVRQGENTIHSMVFEPADRVLHLAYGGKDGATGKTKAKLDLTPFFKK